jgi:hypothetical protein
MLVYYQEMGGDFLQRAAQGLLVALTLAAAAHAQSTTGRILGTITDDSGRALAGVTVRVISPAMIGGELSATTGDGGGFQFLGLFPGNYTLTSELAGFVSQERQEIGVAPGGAASVLVTMARSTFASEIEVVAETPMVDPTQVTTEQIFDLQYLQGSAIGSFNRAYQAILRQAPGVVGGDNPNVFGSTLSDNAIFIDGQDTTDPVTATWGTLFNFDSIAAVEVQTSGFEAEHGRAIGGIVNLVTRSGGNRFSGSLDLRYRAQAFQESGEHYDSSELDSSRRDLSATFGGPLARDRLWFFAAWEEVSLRATPSGSPTTLDYQGTNFNLKLSWQASPGWRAVARIAGSPAETANDNASRFVMPEAGSAVRQGTDLYSLEVDGVLADALLWSLNAGASRSKLDQYPLSGDLATPSHLNVSSGLLTANFDSQQYSRRNRRELASDLSWFVDAAGAHELKLGVQLADTGFTAATCSTGTTGGACSAGSIGYAYWDIDLPDRGDDLPYALLERATAGSQDYDGRLWTVFLQDAWQALPGLILKLGLRSDWVTYENNLGLEVADLDRLQPRLGAAWDIGGDAKNVLRVSWGRFMSPSSLTLPTVLREREEYLAPWVACSTAAWLAYRVESREECADLAADFGWMFRTDDPDGTEPWGWLLPPSQITGISTTQFDPGLESPFADTLSLSFEREIARRAALELTVIDKRTRSLFEDTCEGNVPEPTEGASCGAYYLANLEGLERDYRALILSLQSRTLSWLTLLTSYTYSTSRGNLDYSQGNGPDFDVYPYHWVNRYGFLSDHRRHRFKLNGYLSLAGDWAIAFDGFWSSAFRWQPQADRSDDPGLPIGAVYVEPRGSREGFTEHNLNLQLSKGFTVKGLRLVAIASVLNVFSSEYGTQVCSDVGGCGGFALGEAIDWSLPRRYELGFRAEF